MDFYFVSDMSTHASDNIIFLYYTYVPWQMCVYNVYE